MLCAVLRHSGSLRRRRGARVSLQGAFQSDHLTRPPGFLVWTPAWLPKRPSCWHSCLPPGKPPVSGKNNLLNTRTISHYSRVNPCGSSPPHRTKSKHLSGPCRTLTVSVLLASPASPCAPRLPSHCPVAILAFFQLP